MSTTLTIILVGLMAGIFVAVKAKKTKVWEVFLIGTFGLLLGQTSWSAPYMAALDAAGTGFLAAFGVK